MLNDAPNGLERMPRIGASSLLAFALVMTVFAVSPASAQACHREGELVRCDDGRTGVFGGDAIVWPDGTKSRLAPQSPSVIIGHKDSVQIGQGVFVGNGRGGTVPLDSTSSPNKRSCAVLDGASYCY